MTFKDKIVNFFTRPKSLDKKEKSWISWDDIPEITSSMPGEAAPNLKEEEYLTQSKGWVYACVSAISDEVASIKFQLFEKKGDKLDEVFDHPILNSLYSINPFTTKFDHISLTQEYLELTGEAPWLIEKVDGNIVNIFLLRPDKLTIKFDDTKIIGGYTYEPSPGNEIHFEPEQIIFIKYPNPVVPFRGRGTLQAAAHSVILDQSSERWNNEFFHNSARPDAILTTPSKLTPESRLAMNIAWNKQFKGIGKRAKLAILEGGLTYQPLQLTQKDMDFLEQQRFTRDKILSIFRVPKSVIAITDDVNRANADASAYAFARWTIKPKMQKLIEILNEFYVPLFDNSGNLFLDFQDPVPENIELKAATYEKALGNSGWMTLNEVRNLEGLPPVENGDEIYRPFASAPLGTERGEVKTLSFKVKKSTTKSDKISYVNALKARSESKHIIKEKDIRQLVKSYLQKKQNGDKPVVKKKVIAKKKIKKEIVKKERVLIKDPESFWKKQIKIEETYQDILEKKLKLLFKEQEREVLENLEKEGNRALLMTRNEDNEYTREQTYIRELKISVPRILLDVEKESDKFVVILTPIIADEIEKIGDYTYDQANFDGNFDSATDNIDDFLKAHPMKFSTSINETTNQELKIALVTGIQAGEGSNKLAKRIEGIFDRADKIRAKSIARTESSRAANFATVEAYKQSEVVSGKKWFTALDERTCQWCVAMDGKIVSLDKNYFEKGDTFVGRDGGKLHLDYETIEQPTLHVNCRCTTLPIVVED